MRSILGFALTFLLGVVSPCRAEQQKVYRIGGLSAEDQFIPAMKGFMQRMAELGYSEGKNIAYDFHNAKGDRDVLQRLAGSLVQSRPDLIVTSSSTATVPIAKLTAGTNIPVVFLSAGDPLRFVKSYASSGNNLTGVSSSSLDLIEKRMALLKEITPQIKRIIILTDPEGTTYEHYRRISIESAKRLGLEKVELSIPAKNAGEVRQKISLIKHKLGDGLIVPPDAILLAVTEDIAQELIKEKLPHVGPNVQSVKRGFLAAYSSDYGSLGRQGALLVVKILRGAEPADLPIEQPYRLKLAVNLRTAKSMGLAVPKEVLLRADEVVE